MYVVRLKLKPNGNELKEAEKRFSAMNKLHNVLVSYAKKLLNELDKDHQYQDMLEEYRTLKKKKDRDDTDDARMEALGSAMDTFRKEIGLTEGGLESYCKVWQKRHAKLISSQQAQCEADRVWKSVESVLFGRGEAVHFRKISEIHTIGGKSNNNGTKFSWEDMSIDWTGLVLKCYADWDDEYIREALCLDNPKDLPDISYCQVAREAYEGGYRYYALVYFRGSAPLQEHTCGEGDFGLDPGTSTAAGLSDTEAFLAGIEAVTPWRRKGKGVDTEPPRGKRIRIKYFSDDIEKLAYIGGKSDWIDLRASEDIELVAGDSGLIPLGVAMELPEGYEAHIVPRSSTFKNYGLLQANSCGIIDRSYCGDDDMWKLPVYATRDTAVHKNDRICQFRIVENQPRVRFEEVQSLGNGSRGGFGSTGKS